MKGHPPFAQMFFGALALIHAPLVVPLPSGGGGLEVAFLNGFAGDFGSHQVTIDRKSTRLNSSHGYISYAVFCLKKKNRGRHRRDIIPWPEEQLQSVAD